MNTSLIERLESRIAPASFTSTTVTFEDMDGDDVTIKVSKPIFTNAAVVGAIVIFSGSAFGASGPQRLDDIRLHDLDPVLNRGLDVSVTASRSILHGGNAEISFDSIDASNVDKDTGIGPGLDLGKVVVQGDLRFIDAGDATLASLALKSLDLRSLGAATSGVESDIFGGIGTVKIRGTMQGILVTHDGGGNQELASIASITIGGSMGAHASLGGVVNSSGNIGSFTLKGDLIGGNGTGTGQILTGENLTKLTIAGSIIGGPNTNTADVFVGGTLSTFTLGGSLIGTGNGSGQVTANVLGAIKIGRDIKGGPGMNTGTVKSNTTLGSLTIGGSLIGGTNFDSGEIHTSGDTGPIKIGGSLVGGSFERSGAIICGALKSLNITGSLVGGTRNNTGYVDVNGTIKSVTIGGSVRGQQDSGDDQAFVATIFATGNIDSATINGDFIAGNIIAGIDAAADDQYGSGDDADLSIAVTSRIGKLVIKGSANGSNVSGSRFGIEADEIGTLTVGGVTFHNGDPLGAATISFTTGFFLGTTGDLRVRTL